MDVKYELRQVLVARRAMAFARLPTASALLASNFPSSISVSDQTVVAGYMPFRTEIDPLPLLRAFSLKGAQCAMPRINSPSPFWGRVGMGGAVAQRSVQELVANPQTPPSPNPFPTHSLLGEGGRGDALDFHLCDPDNQNHFTPNKLGLFEPHDTLPTATPNILLVPLLGFDRHGNRIGYGKGYYDNAIAYLRATSTILAIGVAFAEQEVELIPTQPHDQRLDWIITQNEAYRFPS